MTDTAEPQIEPQRPYDTAQMPKNGQRGRTLAKLREAAGIGQIHLANELGVLQPDISRIEREVYGGTPRGFSGRYLAAVAKIAAARGGACFERCGCTKRE